jgi:hypothetical protein
MSRAVLTCLVTSCTIASVFALPLPDRQAGPMASSQPIKVAIEGLVRDIACPIQNPKAKATDFNLQCALECARHGSPLIIQTEDGELYLPISDSMPDEDQHAKLMPFVGKYVRARGTVFERKGTHAIVLSEIKELKDVHLTTDAK